MILNFFYDEGEPWSTVQWGTAGNDKLPLIVYDGAFEDNGFDSLFFEESEGDEIGVPIYIFIDSELKLHYKQRGYMTEGDIDDEINFMLGQMIE
mgnify:CR=1 FL=1